MINEFHSDPCPYLLSSECVPFDWHAQASWRLSGLFIFVCFCLHMCRDGVSDVAPLLRKGHITVSDSPAQERCSVGNEAPEGRQEVGGDATSGIWRACVFEAATFHTNTAECRLASMFGVRSFRFVFLLESVYFLLWYEETLWLLDRKFCPLNECWAACVGRVSAVRGQDMICTYLCSHSWHSLWAGTDKRDIPYLTRTCGLKCRFLLPSSAGLSVTFFLNASWCVYERESPPWCFKLNPRLSQ